VDLGPYFPRNPDGSLKRKKPCQTEGCDWPNWHLCPKANPDDGSFAKLAGVYIAEHNGKAHGKNVGALGEGLQARWARHREKFRERDQNVVDTYQEGKLSMKQIARQYGIAYQTVRSILHRADVEVRPVGLNVGRQSRSA
jgi:hypothetical protein